MKQIPRFTERLSSLVTVSDLAGTSIAARDHDDDGVSLRSTDELSISVSEIESVTTLWTRQISAAVADGPALRAASRAPCCTQRWTLSVMNCPRWSI